MDKPPLNEDLLMHYGVAGMRWGYRRGSGTTGVSRARGAIIDRNDRLTMRIKEARVGKGRRRDRIGMAIDKKILGKEAAARYQKTLLTDMKEQNARMRSGKTTVSDKLEAVFSLTPLDLVLSVKPK